MNFLEEIANKWKEGCKSATLATLKVSQTFDKNAFGGKLQKSLAKQHANMGEYKKAIDYQTKAYEMAERKGDLEEKGNACRRLGKLYFKTGDYEISIHCCEEYLKNASCDRKKKARTKRILGLSYQNLGQNNAAIPHLERCLELFEGLKHETRNEKQILKNDEERAEANGNLGIAYRELREYEKAEDKLKKCLEISKNRGFSTLTQKVFIELACVYKAWKHHESAIRYFHYSLRLAIELQEKAEIAKAYNHLADAYLSQNQPRSAIYYLKNASENCDRLTLLTHVERLGRAYLMNKQPKMAVVCFEEYLSDEANEADSLEKANVIIKRGKSYAELDRHKIAVACYWDGLKMIKKFKEKKIEIEAYEGLGDSYYKTKKYDDSQKCYKEALKISDALDDKQLKGRVLIKLGDIFRVQENTEEAVSCYFDARMIAESIGDKEMQADAYEGLGNSTSEYEQAIENHKKCLQLAIDLVDRKRQQKAHENLGNAYLATKKLSKACESYESCYTIATFRKDIAAVYRCKRNMGDAYFEKKDYENAILHHKICLETATQINYIPEKAELNRVLGCSYSKINQPKKALACYEKFLGMPNEKMDDFKVATVCLDAGKLCTESGDVKSAIYLYLECLNRAEDNLELKQEVYEQLGDAFYKDSQYKNACKYYSEIDQRCIQEPDRRSQINYKLGKAEFCQKDIPMAIKYYYTALDFAQDEKNKADIFEALGEAFFLKKDYDSAISCHTQNLEFARRISDEKRLQIGYEKLGDACSASGQWILAVKYYNQSCSEADEKDRMVKCERKLGNAYYHVKSYKKAIECLENANEKSHLKEKYDIIGHAYAKIGQYKKAMKCFSEDLIADQNDKLRQARTQGSIGKLHIKTGEFQNAIECHKKAVDLIQQFVDSEDKTVEGKEAEAKAYCDLGCAYQANGQYDEALKFQMKSLKLAENLKNKSQQGRAHKKIGNIESATGDYQQAIDSYYTCLDIVKNMEKSTRLRVSSKLGCTWRSIGSHDNAVYHHKEQVNMADNLKEKAQALANLGTDYEVYGDYVQGLKYQEEYLTVAKEMDNDTEQGHAYVNIGKVHLAKGEYKEAIRKSEIAKKLGGKAYATIQYDLANDRRCKEMKIVQIEADSNIGMGHLGTGSYAMAVSFFRNQMKLAEEIGDKRRVGRANENLGNYYAAVGECDKAISSYNKSLEIAECVGDKSGIGRVKGCMGATFAEIGQYRNAVKCHQEEQKIAMYFGNKVREGQALGNLGNAYVGLCDYQKAFKLLDESKEIAEEYNVQDDEKRANRNLGNAFVATGQHQKALSFLGKALEISKQLGHKSAEGRIHESMGKAYYLSGKIEPSIEYSEKSLSIARSVGDRAGEGRALGTLSNAYIEFGQNYQTAISNLRDYLRISKELSNEADQGNALESMAAAFIEIGQIKKALGCCDEALKIAKNLKDKAREGRAYGNFGKLYTAIGDYERAIANHREHLKIATELGDKTEMGKANGNLGNAYNANNKHEAAMVCHKKDRDIADDLNNDAQKARAEGNMGNTYTYIGRFEKALNCHLKRLNIAEKLDDKPSLAKALLGLGVHYIKTDQFEDAIEHLNRLDKISRPADLGNSELTAMAQELLGKCYQQIEVPKACSYFAKSIINFQTIRDSLPDHDEFNISMSNKFAHVHKLLLQSLLNIKEVKTALLVSDCGKAQALHDLMWKMVKSDAGFSLKYFEHDPMEEIAKGLSSSDPERLFSQSLFRVISSNQTDTIISYAFGEDGDLHSWVISKGGVFYKSIKITNEPSMRSYLCKQIKNLNRQLNVTGAQVDTAQDGKKVRDFEARASNPLWLMSDDIESDQERLADPCSPKYDHSTTPRERGPSTKSFPQKTAQNSCLRDLYATLIQPIEEYLTGSKLLVVPEGPLFTLPFAALLDSNGNHLCDKYSLQFIPSLHVLNSCLYPQPVEELGPALFVGNPAISEAYLDGKCVHLDSLQFAEEEVTKCSNYFNAQPLVGQMATKEKVLKEMKTACVIHIAAHGNQNRAEIFLTPNEGNPHDTSSFLLTAEDIIKTPLKARLVVLSSCYSGCGKISAEGVVGIARSFIGSGARAVLVALWAINDTTTKEFMIELYKKLINDKCSVCTALQQTMVVLKRKYWEPRFWAQFQLFGENIVL